MTYPSKQGIEVNEYLQSVTNPAVYAAGDVAATDGPPLTPVSNLEGRIAAQHMLKDNQARPNYTGVPSVVFTVPALARDLAPPLDAASAVGAQCAMQARDRYPLAAFCPRANGHSHQAMVRR